MSSAPHRARNHRRAQGLETGGLWEQMRQEHTEMALPRDTTCQCTAEEEMLSLLSTLYCSSHGHSQPRPCLGLSYQDTLTRVWPQQPCPPLKCSFLCDLDRARPDVL